MLYVLYYNLNKRYIAHIKMYLFEYCFVQNIQKSIHQKEICENENL